MYYNAWFKTAYVEALFCATVAQRFDIKRLMDIFDSIKDTSSQMVASNETLWDVIYRNYPQHVFLDSSEGHKKHFEMNRGNWTDVASF